MAELVRESVTEYLVRRRVPDSEALAARVCELKQLQVGTSTLQVGTS